MANWCRMGDLEPLEFFSERSCFPPLRSGNLDLDKRPSLGVFAFFWAVITSSARIYLGYHYPTDILGGAALGIFHGDLVPKASFTSSRLSASGLGTLCFSIFLCGCIGRELLGWHSFWGRSFNRSPNHALL